MRGRLSARLCLRTTGNASAGPNPLDSFPSYANIRPRRNDARRHLWERENSLKTMLKAQLSKRKGETIMADKELEITPNTYIFAGIGAVLIGGLAYAALGGMQNTVAAAVVGALAGGCLGLFF